MRQHTIRGTLASVPLWGHDQHRRAITRLHIAVTPHVARLRRGEHREDYIRVVVVHLIGHLPNLVPTGIPVTVTGATMTRPHNQHATYTADLDAFTGR